MEHIHGVDVSWMTHGSPQDRTTRPGGRRNTLPSHRRSAPISGSISTSPPLPKVNGFTETTTTTDPPTDPETPTQQTTPTRPGYTRSNSTEKTSNGAGTSPQRRGSWFSNISSKFSSSPAGQSPPQATTVSPKQAEISVPKANPAKNAVLQHAAKYEGEGPYIPAPPRSTQAGLLQVFRRLSSSSSGQLGSGVKGTHGLVERRILNVDEHRERCPLKELNSAKLRRVSFWVDVEIAPMPKYADSEPSPKKTCDKPQKRKFSEKGEGDALKNRGPEYEQTAATDSANAAAEDAFKGSEKGSAEKSAEDYANEADGADSSLDKSARKKEKKKKSEEERKARKEKKRRLEVANGSKPMEIHADSDSSVASTPTVEIAPRPQLTPTTNPVRIYRRCCQLRETPILKKITEQLTNPANFSIEFGVVEKLDLTGYWMQLPDLVTLGDYLAVVPIKEVVLENCGLTDEGLRVVLAGLLAAKKVEKKHRKSFTERDGLTLQGGVVEKLVLRNNKIGPEGWKHLCLFLYLCRSLKILDLSSLSFPRSNSATRPLGLPALPSSEPPRSALSVCQLLSKSLGDRLGGSTLELINLGETGIDAEELGVLVDGLIACGLKRLGLANNSIDKEGMEHVARYLRSGKCEGLDLGGNDIAEPMDILASAMDEHCSLLALSLADCGLTPASLSKLLPSLTKLSNFRFIDLSHNRDLFRTEHSAISLLRRYLPKMADLKRIHLADVAINSEQVIALAEILPEIPSLAHILLLQNPELSKLARAKTEAAQEEACALFASLLAATRISSTIIAVDIDVPTEEAGEIVRAMAKQVVAYCLRNMERVPLGKETSGLGANALRLRDPEYPDVIQHLVGHDVLEPDDPNDIEVAPDDDYVIGGTGVVKALACCLKNRGDDSRRQSGEFIRDSGTVTPQSKLPSGKAKDMSKHLLGSARKIRLRLQPALAKAKSSSGEDTQAYTRLLFLDNTLDGIIKRFEDEYPETRISVDDAESVSPPSSLGDQPLSNSFETTEGDQEVGAATSDKEDYADIVKPPAVSRSNSVISMSSKGLTNEEGRALRVGHKFRAGYLKLSDLFAGVEEIGADPNHNHILQEMLDDLNDEDLNRKAEEKGAIRVFLEDREQLLECLKASDPEHWEKFIESQKMARANVRVDVNVNGAKAASSSLEVVSAPCPVADEEAVTE